MIVLWKIILFLGLSLGAELEEGAELEAKQNLTLFSTYGYNLKNYEFAEKAAETLKAYGIYDDDLLPEKVGWPQKGETLIYKGKEEIIINGKVETYYQVEYKGKYNNFRNRKQYAHASLFRPTGGHEHKSCNCNPCETYNISTLCQSSLFSDLVNAAEKFTSKYSDMEGLEKYFYDYRSQCKMKYHKMYDEEYKFYIKAAAEEFQIPEQLLACLLFKENLWSQNTSEAGAIGMAQFMPDTISHLSNIIAMLDIPLENEEVDGKIDEKAHTIANYKLWVEKYQNAIRENISREANGLKAKRIPKWYKGDYDLGKIKLKNYKLAKEWESYIEKIKKTEAYQKNYPKDPWIGKLPTRFNKKRALIPPLAIGMSALYLEKILQTFESKFPKGSIKSDEDMIHLMKLATGAYNMGPGKAAYLVANKTLNPKRGEKDQPKYLVTVGKDGEYEVPEKVSNWVDKVATNLETKSHMESIGRCMSKELLPPTEVKNKKLVNQNRCGK